MGAPSASAASSSGQNFSSSRYSLPVCELMITPFSFSSVTARPISAAAAFGSCGATAARPALALTPSEYVKRNFAITTSGMNWAPVLRFCIEAVGADNIMFAIDYPYQTTEAAVRFLDEAEISDEDRRKIYHRNAERIFGIPACDQAGGRE